MSELLCMVGGVLGRLISIIVLLCLSMCRYLLRLCGVDIVLRMKLKLLVCCFICLVLLDNIILLVFSCSVFLCLEGEVVNCIIWVLNVWVNFNVMWFRLFRLIMLILEFLLIFQCLSGEYVVMLVYSSGVMVVRLSLLDMCSMNVLFIMMWVEQLFWVGVLLMWFLLVQVKVVFLRQNCFRLFWQLVYLWQELIMQLMLVRLFFLNLVIVLLVCSMWLMILWLGMIGYLLIFYLLCMVCRLEWYMLQQKILIIMLVLCGLWCLKWYGVSGVWVVGVVQLNVGIMGVLLMGNGMLWWCSWGNWRVWGWLWLILMYG